MVNVACDDDGIYLLLCSSLYSLAEGIFLVLNQGNIVHAFAQMEVG